MARRGRAAADGAAALGAGSRRPRGRRARGSGSTTALHRVAPQPNQPGAELAGVLGRAPAAAAGRARRRARLGTGASSGVRARIDELAGPPEPPARLHGDLWSGNVLARTGAPWLIDPAVYGGHREVDLAMLGCSARPASAFLAAYEERFPLAPGHEDRVALWQLYPLLVHAALFGGGYAAGAERVAATRT